MREFVTAAKADTEVIEKIPFTLDGVEYHAYPPTEGQVAIVIAAESGSLADDNERIAAEVDFMFGLFDDETHAALKRRLLDRNDPFGFEDLMNIMEAVIEESTGNPTKPSSASTSSLEKRGSGSTATARKRVATRSA